MVASREVRRAATCLLAATCAAQVVEIRGPVESEARERLSRIGVTFESLENDALIELGSDFVRYAHQRIEVTGNFSVDDTSKHDETLLDDQVKPSYLQYGLARRATVLPTFDDAVEISDSFVSLSYGVGAGKFYYFRQMLRDLGDSLYETAVAQTFRGRQTMASFKDKEINEILAHSWGTQIVYNAILAGDILPPRRLIVVGVPDKNIDKWQ